jgi:PKD repeat protein
MGDVHMASKRRVFAVFTAFLIIFALTSSRSEAAQVQLAWNAPTTDADGTPLMDLAGHGVSYGQTSRSYTLTVDVGNHMTYIVSGLAAAQLYYFAVKAYDTSGNQSASSNEVSATPSAPPPMAPVASFNAVPTSGPVFLTVAFTDTSTGNITSLAWTFGENSAGTQRFPDTPMPFLAAIP